GDFTLKALVPRAPDDSERTGAEPALEAVAAEYEVVILGTPLGIGAGQRAPSGIGRSGARTGHEEIFHACQEAPPRAGASSPRACRRWHGHTDRIPRSARSERALVVLRRG